MLAAKIAFCIYCGKPRTATQELYHRSLTGSAEEFPGDPTGTKYFGAGAGAYLYAHRGCSPETGEKLRKKEAFVADYNALIAKHGMMVSSYEGDDQISDVHPGCRVKLYGNGDDGDELVYVDEYGLTHWQRNALGYVKEKSPHLLRAPHGFVGSPNGLADLVTMGFLSPPPPDGDGHHVLTAKGLAVLEKKS
jgi:hypothetical protein